MDKRAGRSGTLYPFPDKNSLSPSLGLGLGFLYVTGALDLIMLLEFNRSQHTGFRFRVIQEFVYSKLDFAISTRCLPVVLKGN